VRAVSYAWLGPKSTVMTQMLSVFISGSLEVLLYHWRRNYQWDRYPNGDLLGHR
jgi:hypothetical protein